MFRVYLSTLGYLKEASWDLYSFLSIQISFHSQFPLDFYFSLLMVLFKWCEQIIKPLNNQLLQQDLILLLTGAPNGNYFPTLPNVFYWETSRNPNVYIQLSCKWYIEKVFSIHWVRFTEWSLKQSKTSAYMCRNIITVSNRQITWHDNPELLWVYDEVPVTSSIKR